MENHFLTMPFAILRSAVSKSRREIFAKSIPQKVDTSLCNAKYCTPAVRMANWTLKISGDSDALAKKLTKSSV